MSVPPVEFTVFPDDCDAYGHLNQAAALRLFERARWAIVASGPGMDVFGRHGVWPAVRRSTVEYRAQAHPGDVLRLDLELTHHGRTSFTMRQRATRIADDARIAEAEFVFVCVDANGRPAPVPQEVSRHFGYRPSQLPGETRHLKAGEVQLAVDVLGDGPPILFVHGFPFDRTMWRQVAGTLTGWRRIAPDLRGFGLSDPGGGACSIATYADDLAALMDSLRVRRAVVCGLSMGGYVLFELLRRHPDRIRAVILVNTRAAPDDAAARERRDAMIERVGQEGAGVLADDLVPRLLAPATVSTQPQVVERVHRMAAGGSPDGLACALAAMRDRDDARPLLKDIAVPTLVLGGREDQIVPAAEMREMAAAIPGAQVTVVPDAGHLTPIEQPLHTSRIIGEFLAALPPEPS